MVNEYRKKNLNITAYSREIIRVKKRKPYLGGVPFLSILYVVCCTSPETTLTLCLNDCIEVIISMCLKDGIAILSKILVVLLFTGQLMDNTAVSSTSTPSV